jgi:hypothetical protein
MSSDQSQQSAARFNINNNINININNSSGNVDDVMQKSLSLVSQI